MNVARIYKNKKIVTIVIIYLTVRFILNVIFLIAGFFKSYILDIKLWILAYFQSSDLDWPLGILHEINILKNRFDRLKKKKKLNQTYLESYLINL